MSHQQQMSEDKLPHECSSEELTCSTLPTRNCFAWSKAFYQSRSIGYEIVQTTSFIGVRGERLLVESPESWRVKIRMRHYIEEEVKVSHPPSYHSWCLFAQSRKVYHIYLKNETTGRWNNNAERLTLIAMTSGASFTPCFSHSLETDFRLRVAIRDSMFAEHLCCLCLSQEGEKNKSLGIFISRLRFERLTTKQYPWCPSVI